MSGLSLSPLLKFKVTQFSLPTSTSFNFCRLLSLYEVLPLCISFLIVMSFATNFKLLITYTKAKWEGLVLPSRMGAWEKRGEHRSSMIPLFVLGFDEGFKRISEKYSRKRR